MERITECTENVTTDTETESIVSNENFTLRKIVRKEMKFPDFLIPCGVRTTLAFKKCVGLFVGLLQICVVSFRGICL